MKLILTHDGMIGWQCKGEDTRWFRSDYMAMMWGFANFPYEVDEFKLFESEFNTAIATMRSGNCTSAEFGIKGTFMYAEQENG